MTIGHDQQCPTSQAASQLLNPQNYIYHYTIDVNSTKVGCAGACTGINHSSQKKADQGKSPGPEGVHASSPLTVRNGPLGRQDRLYNESVDDCEEEHTGVQGAQHIQQASLRRHLVPAMPACPHRHHEYKQDIQQSLQFLIYTKKRGFFCVVSLLQLLCNCQLCKRGLPIGVQFDNLMMSVVSLSLRHRHEPPCHCCSCIPR